MKWMLISLICLASCTKATPEDKGRLIKASIDASRAGCLVLLADTSIPREPQTLEYCNRLMSP
jgi:hypothetical protein